MDLQEPTCICQESGECSASTDTHVVCQAREGKGHLGEEDLQAGRGADQQVGRRTLTCLVKGIER